MEVKAKESEVKAPIVEQKHEAPKAEAASQSKEKESPKSKTVSVLSLRAGKVICPCGTVLLKQEVAKVSKETAEWLEVTFPGEMKRI